MIPVHITDENQCIATGNHAIKLYNLGRYGTPMKGGMLNLTSFETLHLLELGKICMDPPMNIADIASLFARLDPDFMSYYLIYKDLRFRGYIVGINHGLPRFFRLYGRGQKKENLRALHYVHPLREGQNIPIKDLQVLMDKSNRAKKSLVIGLVDSSGDVSYMRVSSFVLNTN